ncbi:class I adenylate-forming enzyme family protein [Tropicibacter naphthalenivorans]|uniref:Long-chain-fatty-acid--CoA ligase n=1 Tax=Tropicibacter naphthalenivorans TaxID=441103 RepID=A0A0P1GHG7_9RHOB|nr:class I adenylate-forming enzyme family protein [Tropicibacter naphthalenivorans]CUH81131.1 Long-chain-fatty-acid--CoA ligase [Tropicibacter naphthalenivorans]SMC97290.1 Acyl-CoA synthetase (AMP-forming)/AMP-acid ligase II [Tropicibacter naphthalenivorans]
MNSVELQAESRLADRFGRFHQLVSHWAGLHGDAPALVENGRRVTWTALDALTDQVASALTGAGLRAQDRILIVAENSISAIALVTAANRVGACCSILNARMTASEIRSIAAFAEPRMIAFPLVDASVSNVARKLSAEFDASPLIDTPFGQITACPAQDSTPNDASDDLGLIMFTSGTTGTPKGVMLTNATLLAQGEAQVINRELTPDDSIYLVSPIAHAIGLSSNVISAFASGARLHVAPQFNVAELVTRIAAGDVTMMVAVPQLYTRILEHIAREGLDMSDCRLRVGASGGAPLDPALKARVKEVMGVTLSNGYGATEFVPVTRVPIGREADSNVVGLPSPGVEVRIVNETGADVAPGESGEIGADVAPGESGEIWARGPFCMKGYFRNPSETDAVLKPGGWLATGDLGEIRAVGMLAIVGRKKEIIIRSGFNVDPADGEAALTAHPDVMESAVVGGTVPGNEEVVAFVTAAPGKTIDVDALSTFARQSLTAYKVPSEIIVIDTMPIGPTGKIQKALLKERL